MTVKCYLLWVVVGKLAIVSDRFLKFVSRPFETLGHAVVGTGVGSSDRPFYPTTLGRKKRGGEIDKAWPLYRIAGCFLFRCNVWPLLVDLCV